MIVEIMSDKIYYDKIYYDKIIVLGSQRFKGNTVQLLVLRYADCETVVFPPRQNFNS